MALTTGTKPGPYEIVAPLGAGGMGEVYQARGTRLNRTIAVKVPPVEFAASADRLRRFHQEATAFERIESPESDLLRWHLGQPLDALRLGDGLA